jgi:pimeloyl-ACP methyl ester carboxylesterase
VTRPEPFRIAVPAQDLADLTRRLRSARFPPDYENSDWRYGFPSDELRQSVDAWLDFDWRAQEDELNKLSHFRLTLDEVPIHFVHCRGRGPNSRALILSHGWPWTFWDWHETLGPLTDPEAYGGSPEDSFDVVVPSLPGFAFSTPLTRGGTGFSETADLWLRLMRDVLGYDSFFAAGGDMGNVISAQLGHKYPQHVRGVHLLGAIPLTLFAAPRGRPSAEARAGDWGFERPARPPEDPILARLPQHRPPPASSHRTVHMIEPQTIAAALHDSPVGLMAWLGKGRLLWSDRTRNDPPFTPEFLHTTYSLYWLTQSFGSSARMYWESAVAPWQPVHDGNPVVTAPTGITFFAHDMTSRSRFWCADYYNLIRASERAGGHFAPAEVPEIVVEELRATFRMIR